MSEVFFFFCFPAGDFPAGKQKFIYGPADWLVGWLAPDRRESKKKTPPLEEAFFLLSCRSGASQPALPAASWLVSWLVGQPIHPLSLDRRAPQTGGKAKKKPLPLEVVFIFCFPAGGFPAGTLLSNHRRESKKKKPLPSI